MTKLVKVTKLVKFTIFFVKLYKRVFCDGQTTKHCQIGWSQDGVFDQLVSHHVTLRQSDQVGQSDPVGQSDQVGQRDQVSQSGQLFQLNCTIRYFGMVKKTSFFKLVGH